MPSSISGLNFVDLCCLERVVMCFWRDYQKLLSSWFDLPIRVHYSFQTFENLGSCTFGAPAHVKIDRLSLKYKITWFLFVQQHLFAFLSLITFICFCVLEREVSFDGKIMKNSKVIVFFPSSFLANPMVANWCYGSLIVCRCVFVFMIFFSAKRKSLFLFCRKFANLWCGRLSGVFVFMICSKQGSCQGPLWCSHFGLSGLKLER